MKVGFKTGPKNWESEGRSLASRAEICEVWFDVRQADSYTEMIAELRHNGVEIGLHHWGLIDGKYKTNLATNFEPVRSETIEQIKQTLDIAAEIDGVYVNAHPGARFLEMLRFSPWQQRLVADSETSPEESRELFLTAVDELQTYAVQRGVVLTIETLPALEMREGHAERDNAYAPENVDLSILAEMCVGGGWLANDITHTAAQLMYSEVDLEIVWHDLMKFTRQCADNTKLLHINTVTPPFNGSDSHHGLLDDDFGEGAWPTQELLGEFLEVFAGRDDVLAVPEPQTGWAAANFDALRELVNSVS